MVIHLGKNLLGTVNANPPKPLGFSFGRETTDIRLAWVCSDSEVVCVALERGYDVLNAIQRDQPDP